MREASDDALWFLHTALEKGLGARIVRGGWGKEGGGRLGAWDLRDIERAAACPLTALALGAPPSTAADLKKAAALSELRLRRHGFTSQDFYTPWDRGWISGRRLLRIVDGETMRRL